jgi:hypothetical protein
LLFSFSSKSTISSSVAPALFRRYFSQTVALQANFGETLQLNQTLLDHHHYEEGDFRLYRTRAFLQTYLWRLEKTCPPPANQSDPTAHRNKGSRRKQMLECSTKHRETA